MRILNQLKYNLPENLKNRFHNSRNEANIIISRIVLLVGIFFYGIFAFVDKLVAPEIYSSFFVIRFYIVIPILTIIILSTFSKQLIKYLQPIISLAVITAGSGIILMISISSPSVNNYYYPGIILVFMLNYIFLNVNLKWSIIAGLILVTYYEYVIFFILDVSRNDLIINNFFFLSSNFLGIVAKMFLEYAQKREFHTAFKLEQTYNIVQNNNSHLEERVKERTTQLKKTNVKLENEIKDKEEIEKNLVISKEAAEQANQLKSEFLAQMSHEIRSPIGVINNFTYLLEDLINTNGNKDLETCFLGIDSASKRIVRTIDLILNTSELQLGTYEPSFREIDLSEMIISLNKEYSKIAENKGLKIIFDNVSKSSKITTDDYAISQIFANLLDNAIKYTDKGHIEINLNNDENNNLVFVIKDSGKGMSEKFLMQLFNPFSQEETGYSRKFEGNGLGLSLVKNYSKIIHASIDVESKQSVGTTFTLTFHNKRLPSF